MRKLNVSQRKGLPGDGGLGKLFGMETTVRKRKLRSEKGASTFWKQAIPAERLAAVDTINRLKESEYAEQAFPRVHRVIRSARR